MSLSILLGGALAWGPMAGITASAAGLATRVPSGFLGGKLRANLFVVVQHGGGDKDLLQAFATTIARIVMCDNYVV